MQWNSQSGKGRLGFLLSVAFLGAGIFLAVKIIPVRIAAYNFRDVMRQECRMGAVRNSDEVVAKRILSAAEDLRIPLQREDLEVRRSKRRMVVRASYAQPIDLKVTTYVYRFSAEEEAPLF